ncbi:MAG: hypothetical protein HN350_03865 [Phycisphaerales bacterium]|nr:hypothetical protein [Phycisphaerales bacterium]
MASFKLNIAQIKGCPPPDEVLAAMDEFGLPKIEEFGVLSCSATDKVVLATIVRKTQQAVQRLDTEAKELTAAPVEKAVAYPVAIKPASDVVEIYAGSATGIEQIGYFLSGCLAFPVVVEPIKIDIPSAIDKLVANTERCQLQRVRVSDYSHNSFMIGPYTPKFLDSQHGMDFLNEYVEAVTSASLRFAGPSGRVMVTLSQAACFSFSCSDDDLPYVQSILRKLI